MEASFLVSRYMFSYQFSTQVRTGPGLVRTRSGLSGFSPDVRTGPVRTGLVRLVRTKRAFGPDHRTGPDLISSF